MTIRLILADDHHLMREGLRKLIETTLKMEVVGEAGDGNTAVELVREHMPDIVIMDVNLPGMDGICATRKIKGEFPDVKVIALSMHANKLFVEDMFAAGASAYILKNGASEELATVISTVMKGDIYITPKVAGIVINDYRRDIPDEQGTDIVLTKRECQVLRMVANGSSTKEIAMDCKKSVQTIDACRRQIMDKLQIDNIAELIKYAIREGLTSVDY